LHTIKEISEHVEEIKDKVAEMLEERKKANRIEDLEQQAIAYNQKVMPYLGIIRQHVDKLELMVDDELWPLPKYRELLFNK
jgi:glutamine synthetase